MKQIGIFLLTILLINSANGQIIIDELDDSTNPDIILDDRELLIIQKIATIESKINTLPSNSDVEQYNAIVYQALSNEFRDKTDFMILAFSMILLFVLGIAISLFFYLKAKRRL